MLILNKQNRAKKWIDNLPFMPQQAKQIYFLTDSRAFKTRILQLISQAKQRIYITALYWQKDEAGQEILEALYQAKIANPALEIKVLVDWHRAQRGLIGAEDQSSNADWYLKMREKYALPQENDIAFFGVPINSREIFGVLHLKGFVFDDTLLYSGASINNVYLQQFERYRYDRYHQIENPQLADAIVAFIQQQILDNPAVSRLDVSERQKTAAIRPLVRAFRKQLSQQQYQYQGQTLDDQQLMLALLIGLGRKNRLNKTIEALFYQVSEKLTICTPYFNFPRSLRNRIAWLLETGKQIEIVVGDKTANDFYTPPDEPFTMASALPYLYEKNLRAFAKRFDAFIQNGQLTIRLWRHENNSYHLKGVWIDSRYILLTGNNLNPRAWGLDAENAVLISDPLAQLKTKADQELAQIRTHTNVLTHYSDLEKLKDYPDKVQKLLKKFGRVKLDKIVKMLL
ncbi:CDP-diacylglycerol--serine O-phosphatidyltransferase [Muribacter muris]|uniref:CDP-diacylglycerol--serine O-phosphatidyltransferase n=1 Tax=Muribacter muris TaxID=67855 RepID=A0A4Y9K041_9PAST|nr:CDP-diacylglycerol--serine O-phosphatidyltransferase [Muribacter muris]MBF0784975.1 CDP-diacylglycerol--serine O-phosphatidyltransferase [Muribacter muris]MBF0827283.1 CDP-diacylglycerol--serine O-phosphatidyltransferase [Muribacter muris]TFV10892.1 CDP-diacylglycerol--serine O-phosphatidyltransferase [Muribacter muris]